MTVVPRALALASLLAATPLCVGARPARDALPPNADAGSTTIIPTTYEAGHFYATPMLASGEALKLVVDTGGGGGTWELPLSTIHRLQLKPATCDTFPGAFQSPAFVQGKGLPRLKPRGCDGVGSHEDNAANPFNAGIVGGWYLSAGTWTFDYPSRRLVLEGTGWTPQRQAHAADLAFLLNQAGALGTPYPRITISVAGEPIDMLLDTGATARPTAAGRKAMHTHVAADGLAAGSYVTTSVLNRWHAAHPEWPVVDAADDLSGSKPMSRTIRVPDVTVAGFSTGPAWFTERPDANFDDRGMSRWMEGEVHGAVGGNILSHFRMTIDYPHRKAWFTCVEPCSSADQSTTTSFQPAPR